LAAEKRPFLSINRQLFLAVDHHCGQASGNSD
jgi:hypothetical protein